MHDITQTVGNNLQNFRKEKHLTLQDLSDLTGVSKSMLGEIERGSTNPTITILWKIITGLKITISDLVHQEKTDCTIVKKDDWILLQEIESHKLSLIFEHDDTNNFEIYHLEFSPRGEHHSKSHSKGISEYTLVYEGQLTIVIDGQSYVLNSGDSFIFNAETDHSYINKSNKISKAYSIIYYSPFV